MMETLTRLWRKAPQPAVLQLSRGREADWAELQLPQARRRLCREIRRKVPVADAALDKIVRLTGEFTVHSEDPRVEEELRRIDQDAATTMDIMREVIEMLAAQQTRENRAEKQAVIRYYNDRLARIKANNGIESEMNVELRVQALMWE